MYCPAASSASVPLASWPTVTAPPSYRSVNAYCWIIPGRPLPQPTTLPVPQHASVVRNVPRPCCAWNLFLPGTLPNSCTKGSDLTPPKLPPIPLSLTESSTPIAFVPYPPLIALHQPLTSVSKPRPHTLCCWPRPNLSLLTTLLSHSQRGRIFESPKQNP